MQFKNLIYKGSNNRLSGYDLFLPEQFNGNIIYFIHGYKGYKNWGVWDLIAQYFYNIGYGFAKCNLSHNGTTVDSSNNFTDLEAFALNRYSYELNDIEAFIKTVDRKIESNIKSRILIGHSRGGGDAILSIPRLPQIDILITWAAIANIENRFLKGKDLQQWKTDGVFTVLNGRTKQFMPHYYSFYEDYLVNKELLNIKQVAKQVNIPWAIIHGDGDQSVLFSEAEILKNNSKHAQLFNIKSANHVFGAKEPYNDDILPNDTIKLIEITKTFIEQYQ